MLPSHHIEDGGAPVDDQLPLEAAGPGLNTVPHSWKPSSADASSERSDAVVT